MLSTHLIDEVSNLLERVLVIDEGRIIIDESADALRGSASTVVGTHTAVDAVAKGQETLHREAIGGIASVTFEALSTDDRAEAARAGLELSPVSLQQLIVRKINTSEKEFEQSA